MYCKSLHSPLIEAPYAPGMLITVSAADDEMQEVPLLGGDVTGGLVRVSNTVRRPGAVWSPAIAQLLAELETAGFTGAPRHLGIDDRGRHVLSYVDGQVASRPWPEWVSNEGTATSVARLVRAYDDAALLIGIPAWAKDLTRRDPPNAPATIADTPSFIGHMDITPENVVFRAGAAVALIDFDLARPATRVEEVCNILLWWGAWMPERDREPVMRSVDPFERGARIVDAYALDTFDRAQVVEVAQNEAARSWHSMKHRSETIGGGWRRMWDAGVGDRILRRQHWLAANADLLDKAVTIQVA